ncbi:MAG: NADH-quinone oxidoreductase subunit C [Candidatus Bipolaricaulota bacterium]|nr:MAG: NADH-quinone oxidoreductase subunit C [Candidatus Bipolaricaulota bacterium]
MKPDELLAVLTGRVGSDVTHLRTVEHRHGAGDHPIYDLWVEVPRERLRDAIGALCAAASPQITTISGDDVGDRITLNYHLNVGWGEHYSAVALLLRTSVPKSALSIDTISDLIPGALTAEREKREFYGMTIDGIPDDRNLFLPEDSTIHPWRKDEESLRKTEAEVKRLVKWETRDA